MSAPLAAPPANCACCPARPPAYGFRTGLDLPLVCDPHVVDETSMVAVPLMASLFAALPPEALPVARLSEVFRQAA